MTFFAQVEDAASADLPQFVKDEFDAFLECGILAHGLGLASKILARIARQLPHDWHQRYGYRPVLLETFVESMRHRGTCYKAANWIHVGQTTGRGKKSRVHHQIIPVKDIWLYPMRKDFAQVLCQ